MRVSIPTVEEIALLQSKTQNSIDLFNSNLFKLQADEYLRSVTPKKKQLRNLNTTLENVKSRLSELRTHPLDTVTSHAKRTKVRLSSLKQGSTILASPPENCKMVLEPPSNVTMIPAKLKTERPLLVIQLPEKCLQKKDNQNYRYLCKLEVYRAYLNLDVSEEFKTWLVPASGEGWHKPSKFYENKSNISQRYLLGDRIYNNQEDIPTPQYNEQILLDLLHLKYYEYLQDLYAGVDGDRNNLYRASILLTGWLKNRRLDKLLDGFSVDYLLVYLVNEGSVASAMPVYHIVKTFWKKYSEMKSFEATCSTQGDECSHVGKVGPVLMDHLNHRNMLFNISQSYWQRFVHECNTTTAAHVAAKCPTSAINTFSQAFYSTDSLLSYYDAIVYLKHGSDLEKCAKILTRALQSRVKLVAADQNVNGQPLLGVIFESEEYNSKDCSIFKCEHVGNSAGSREFREFWGDKSELRRFADGATRETVIFESIEQAMKFAVKRHMNQNPTILLHDDPIPTKKLRLGDEKISPRIAYEDFSRMIHRADKDLPLKVTDVQHNSALVSGGTCEDTAAHKSTIDVIVELEKSVKWPEDLAAVQRCKAAFLAELARRLASGAQDEVKEKMEESGQEEESKVVFLRLSSDLDCVPERLCLLVGYRKMYVFRVELSILNERNLYEKTRDAAGMVLYKPCPESIGLHRRTQLEPRARGLLKGLQNQETFGRTVYLFKRWLSNYKLSNHFSDLAVQLLLSALLQPLDFSTAQAGFLKALKRFFEFDFLERILVVNPNDDSSYDSNVVRQYFEENREVLPACFISTPVAPNESPWTERVSFAVLQKAQKLAKLTFDRLENGQKSLKDVIDSPVSISYDYTLTLPAPNSDTKIETGKKRKQQGRFEATPKLALVKTLEKAFRGNCVIFSGDNGSENEFIGIQLHSNGGVKSEGLRPKDIRVLKYDIGSYQFDLLGFLEDVEMMSGGKMIKVEE